MYRYSWYGIFKKNIKLGIYSSMTKVQKAIRATIKLGDIDLDVFQLPDGKYRMSQTQILEVIDIAPKRYTEIRDSKVAQTFDLKGLDLYRISLENKAKANTISLDDVPKIWRVCIKLKRGNQDKLEALLDACLVEVLERRADNAFDVKQTEEARNLKFKARVKGKVTRRKLTDAIRDYIKENNCSEEYRKDIYGATTNNIYLYLFGCTAAELKRKRGVGKGESLRDAMGADELKRVEDFEAMVMRRIDHGVEPIYAVQEANYFGSFRR